MAEVRPTERGRPPVSTPKEGKKEGKKGQAFDIGVTKAEVLDPQPDEHIGSLYSSSTDTVY